MEKPVLHGSALSGNQQGVVALICNVLLGYGQSRMRVSWMLIVPLTLSTTFFLIADIDSPRTGVIRMPPVNLISLAQALKP